MGLGILGTLFLAYMAYLIFSGRHKLFGQKQMKYLKRKSLIKYYFQGFALTGVNPYTIAFWLSIAGYVTNQALNPFFTLVGLFLAIFLWINHYALLCA